jgi:predicted RNA binding protein YcfA (HicA-like mRNA interferase family)
MAPLKPNAYIKLLRRWGFSRERHTGGHLVMTFGGRRVQVTTSGRRSMPMPWKALREAAEIVGVDLQHLLAGPVKLAGVAVPVNEIRVTQPCGCVLDEHGCTPCSQHSKERETVMVEEEVATTQRRRRRTGGKNKKHQGTSIVEVVGQRSRGRSRKFSVQAEDIGIEVPEVDDELDLSRVVTVADKPTKVTKPAKARAKVEPEAAVTGAQGATQPPKAPEPQYTRQSVERSLGMILPNGFSLDQCNTTAQDSYEICVVALGMLLNNMGNADPLT